MSRSRRKPVERDKPNGAKYHRTVRRVTKEKVRFLNELLDDDELPDPKEIVNDYDYSDWKQDLRFRNDEMSKKSSRK